MTTELPPLSTRQRTILMVVAVVCAATRFLAMARSLWDWDEALFCLGVRGYDVAQHHPHPPGFPLYIALGKLVRLVAPSDFRALQSINLLAGMLLFPAVFLLTRELRFRFETAVVAATLCAFFPNVWFFGGGAFSDLPSIVLIVFATAFLFRGWRDDRAYLLGTLLLAIAIGVRPQNLLIGLFPGIVATWIRLCARRIGIVVAAASIGIVIVGASYGGAMAITGYARYMAAVRVHSEYISRVDSFHSPDRPPLWRLFDRFFLKQYQQPLLGAITSVFVAISAVGAVRRRDHPIGYAALAFGPFAIAAWLMLDRFSVTRFSIGYAPLFALLAADGIGRVAEWLAPKLRTSRVAAEVAMGSMLVAAFFAWTLPALSDVRNNPAPTAAAIDAVKKQLDPRRDRLYFDVAMSPFVDYFLADFPRTKLLDENALPLSDASQRWFVTEIDKSTPAGLVFRRPKKQMWNIARRHYFVVALEPIARTIRFGDGWYAPEHGGVEEWRWIGAHAVAELPAANGDTSLRIQLIVPDETLPQHPMITVMLDGAILERFTADARNIERDYRVTPSPDHATHTLVFDVDKVANPAKLHTGTDTRDLGLLIKYISWGPA